MTCDRCQILLGQLAVTCDRQIDQNYTVNMFIYTDYQLIVQTWKVLLWEAERILSLSDEKVIEMTPPLCATIVVTSFPVFEFQTWYAPSLAPSRPAIHLPSNKIVQYALLGMNATARIPSMCECEGWERRVPMDVSQMQTCPPNAAATSFLPDQGSLVWKSMIT